MNQKTYFRPKNPGMQSGFECAVRFHLWMLNRKAEPKLTDITKAFDIHRSTAHRWLRAYQAALGVCHAP